ncbi:Inward rectifier potassium channel 2-like [Oopsacas minuta]|uniref:Inward rectifier potassium channel 2-like n=1 Tax=Oopsacas minuta TaxID=111878 RepID=A0AAV7KJP8_9METZ|nr:Inward rectifier potassium channel 2-like [Oopsacas minuta]
MRYIDEQSILCDYSVRQYSSMACSEPLIESESSLSNVQFKANTDQTQTRFSLHSVHNNEYVMDSKYRGGSINSSLSVPTHTHLPNRLVHKNGTSGVLLKSSNSQRGKAYVFDVYTTLIDCKWWVFILLIIFTYIFSYLMFGIFWYGASFIPDHDDKNTTCVQGVDDPLSAFFLSIEVQSTIGFGHRYPRSDYSCIPDFLILFTQTIAGLFIDAFYLALIVTKISRPYRRKATILFSSKACVCRDRNDRWWFKFRVTDIRKVKLVEPHVKLFLFYLSDAAGKNGIHYDCNNLDVGYDEGIDRLQLILPSEVCHEINPSSPLFKISPIQLRQDNFEIVVVLEGIVEGTGSTTQVMTSYRGAEISFGYTFVNLLELNHNKICINLARFNVLAKSEDYSQEKSISDLKDDSTES